MSDVNKPLRALIIEDSEIDAELLIRELECADYSVSFERVCTAETVREALQEKTWDIIFSDHSMPHFNSWEALLIRNESDLDVPFIILSGTIGEDIAVDAMRAGASDYIIKGNTARLIPAVKRELQEAKDREYRRNAEQELGYFVAALTHDLRTPLLAELRIFELFDKEAFGPLNAQQHDLLKDLLQSNYFMQHMVSNILHAYKYKQHHIDLYKEPTDLNQFIESLAKTITIQSLLREKSHKLVLRLTNSLSKVEVDHNELQRVFINLIKNAIDATPSTGIVTIFTEPKESMIRINIQDTGNGIDSEIRQYLFKPYAICEVKRFKKVSMGLGLYLCKQIIEAHGGSIGFESQPGEGSLFYFDLPIKGSGS